jgi:hypothetical protein
MRYRLRDGLHYCVAGSDVIFLDVCQNRYSALPAVASNAFQRIADREGLTFEEDETALHGLIRDGHLAATDGVDGALRPVGIQTARADLLNAARRPLRFRDVALAFFWETRMALELRGWPLSSVLRRVGLPRAAIARIGRDFPGEITALSQAFDHTALILGRTNRCLVRSLALFSVLRNRDIAAQFVIGVRTQPFAAHAWVQYDGTVLNDGVEQVSCYTPILALA